MNLKKLFMIVMACVLVACALVSCTQEKENNGDETTPSKETENTPTHTHKASGDWQSDKDNHWKICADDEEKVDVAAHTLEKDKCTVCGVGVVKEGDVTNLYYYDANGNWITCIHYGADGKTTEDTIDYVYDDKGNIKTMKMTADGKVVYEGEYAVDDSGYNYEAESTQYSEDGSKLTMKYTADGDITRETKVKADGTIEYDYRTEHVYGENAKKKSEKTYSGDKLIKEVNYIVLFEDSWGGGSYKLEVITYNEDGTKTVEYFNESGEPYTE